MLREQYCDTSFIVPLLLKEATSEPIGDFVRSLDQNVLVTSTWTRTEFNSLLGIRVRSRSMEAEDARRAEEYLDKLLESFGILDVAPADLELARRMLRDFDVGLRAGDALHLAIARNRGAENVLSLDKKMLRAGRVFGITATTGAAIAGYEL